MQGKNQEEKTATDGDERVFRRMEPRLQAAGDIPFPKKYFFSYPAPPSPPQPGLTNPPPPCDVESAWRRTVQTRMAPH